MEDSYGGYSGGGKKAVDQAEDLQEEEVWAMINAREGSNSSSKTKSKRDFSSSSYAWHVEGGGEESSLPQRAARHRSSAPVEIPDCSKILKKNKKKITRDGACDAHSCDSKVDAEEEEEGEDEAPPHEVLARRLARTRIVSHSMCEGVGRTLKGRDLSKTRNAILTKTGFIE
ncbi:protein S40-7-like [Salvia miltiorrhiza]|uniref:protein S40-7-like n=1 Tax=Salvia miltiorrhiza TaxID=226208 RepID=UPI0025AC718C|nr:protein S40-7-like [Salvia miltiorrhiza]